MTKSRHCTAVFPALLISTALVGCEHAQINRPANEPEAEPAPNTPATIPIAPRGTGGGPRAADSAMTRAIQARCHREERCHNVGPNHAYATLDDCFANVAVLHPEDFAGLVCGGSVRAPALDMCIDEIESDTCSSDARFTACRSTELCNPM
jgi:hypothetical protein